MGLVIRALLVLGNLQRPVLSPGLTCARFAEGVIASVSLLARCQIDFMCWVLAWSGPGAAFHLVTGKARGGWASATPNVLLHLLFQGQFSSVSSNSADVRLTVFTYTIGDNKAVLFPTFFFSSCLFILVLTFLLLHRVLRPSTSLFSPAFPLTPTLTLHLRPFPNNTHRPCTLRSTD